jgi:hypothetical protein
VTDPAASRNKAAEIVDGYLRRAKATPSTWPLRGLLGLAGMWFLTNLSRLFSAPTIDQTSWALLASAVYAVVTWMGLSILRQARSRGRGTLGIESLALALYNNGVSLIMSAFWIRLYLDIGLLSEATPSWLPTVGILGYFGTAFIGLLYAPHSFPSTFSQQLQAERRARTWAPYVVGLPAAGVSVGTFLGTVTLHYSVGWEIPLIACLCLFLACAIVGISMINLHRTWLFAKAVNLAAPSEA